SQRTGLLPRRNQHRCFVRVRWPFPDALIPWVRPALRPFKCVEGIDPVQNGQQARPGHEWPQHSFYGRSMLLPKSMLVRTEHTPNASAPQSYHALSLTTDGELLLLRLLIPHKISEVSPSWLKYT